MSSPAQFIIRGTDLELNRILASLCRQKILLELSKQKELTIMALVRAVNSTYGEVNRNIQLLIGQKLVTQKFVGRLRLIRLNWENKDVSVLLKALRSLETQTVINQRSTESIDINNDKRKPACE